VVVEHKLDFPEEPNNRDGREDIPEGQMALGQARLHGWGSDLASEFQRPMRPEEVVILDFLYGRFLCSVGKDCG